MVRRGRAARQIGDVLDRGVGEVVLLRLDELRQQAAKAGGEVVCLVENLQVMNYEGDFRYVSGDWGEASCPSRSTSAPP